MTFTTLSCQEAKKLLGDTKVIIVDARSEASYNEGHIPGALHLSVKTLPAFCEKNQGDEPILVYCQHGISSQSVAQHLVEKGCNNVISLKGGYEAWQLLQSNTQPSD